MKEIKQQRIINDIQLSEELKSQGIEIKGIVRDRENNITIELINDADETKAKTILSSHTPKVELTRKQRIDNIATLEDVKKYLKGEL